MVFSSLTFLYLFLPLAVIPYFLWKNRVYRNVLLLVLSLFFYAWGEPKYVGMMVAATAVAYFGGRGMAALTGRPGAKKAIFVVTVCLVVLNLLVFKYLNFFWDNAARLFSSNWTIPQIALPIGISFYTFQILSYVIDLYLGRVALQRNFFYLLLYISFFPQLIAGPIVRYSTIEEEILHRQESWADVEAGLKRFIVGLSKKVLLANNVAVFAEMVYGGDPSVYGTAMYWLAALSYTLQIYFDFSGYSDMAIGLGRMFGFRFLENFNLPYSSRSIKEFWRRWHISLSSWFRDYLYIPLGGNRKGRARTNLNKLIVFFATGLWHGANWTFVLWGLWHGLFSTLEGVGAVPRRLTQSRLGHLYTMLVVVLGFTLFRAETITQAGVMFRAMFTGFTFLPANTLTLIALLDLKTVCLLVVALLFALGIPQFFWEKLKAAGVPGGVRSAAGALGYSALFGVSVLTLAGATFNPFIYFQF